MREIICRGLRDELLPDGGGGWGARNDGGGWRSTVTILCQGIRLNWCCPAITALVLLCLACLQVSSRARSKTSLDGGECADSTPSKHYLVRAGSCFWVAVDEISTEIVGTVAVERCRGAHPITAASRGTWATPAAPWRRVVGTRAGRRDRAVWRARALLSPGRGDAPHCPQHILAAARGTRASVPKVWVRGGPPTHDLWRSRCNLFCQGPLHKEGRVTPGECINCVTFVSHRYFSI